ncbi:glycoside hydrolase family 2 protein [Vibrio proteolyticus]|nr:glycoside hydrolase family 2 protein [Vibrio proteolyticus]
MMELNGEWRLSSPQYPHINTAMQLPGDHYSALLAGEFIPDPYYASNEADVQWPAYCDWHLSKTLRLDILPQCRKLTLTLNKVDTFASLYINNQLVVRCSNAFQQYQINILPFLNVGDNHFEWRFQSAAKQAHKHAAALPFPVPWAEGNNQIPHMNTIRKPQCHSGWDWGICLPVCGVFTPIQLVEINEQEMYHVDVEQQWHDLTQVSVVVTITHRPAPPATVQVEFASQRLAVTTDAYSRKTRVVVDVNNPILWWPNGYGDAHLYPLQITLDQQRIQKQIGLRQLVLRTRPDQNGNEMVFVVNGIDITAKGANWIPVDAMPGRITPARYHNLLEAAKEANMNMIRVWGGGDYEQDIFYQLCDQLGLLVWQDLMFACAQYPSTAEFLVEVEQEVEHQVSRLKHHACLALWCGDNEVIGSLNWYPESRHNREKYLINYDRLNRMLEETVTRCDPSRRFWASSPCNGELDFGDAWHDDNKGDMHFWDVWHSGKSFSAYREVSPRFCSEFGYQSWPSLPEVKQFLPDEAHNITAQAFEHHQKNARGTSIITEMFTRYFRFPDCFEQMLYLSQVQQAMAISTAVESWRAKSPHCRGMLYWQLNDNWPVSSWSSIEYSGRWKQLHYHAVRFYQPLLACFSEQSEQVCLHAINDSRDAKALCGEVLWLSWEGELRERWVIDEIIPSDRNQVVWRREKRSFQAESGALYFVSQSEPTRNTFWLPAEPKRLPLQHAVISVQMDGQRVRLQSDLPVLYVHLEHSGVTRFSDSSFFLLPGMARTIEIVEGALNEDEELRVYQLI